MPAIVGCGLRARSTSDRATRCVVNVMAPASAMAMRPPSTDARYAAVSSSNRSTSARTRASVSPSTSDGTTTKPRASNCATWSAVSVRNGPVRSVHRKSRFQGCSRVVVGVSGTGVPLVAAVGRPHPCQPSTGAPTRMPVSTMTTTPKAISAPRNSPNTCRGGAASAARGRLSTWRST